MFISASKSDILRWESVGTDSFYGDSLKWSLEEAQPSGLNFSVLQAMVHQVHQVPFCTNA